MKTKFTAENRHDLWTLRQFYGHGVLIHWYNDPTTMRDREVTSEHADRLMSAGQAVWVVVPIDPASPVEAFRVGEVR